MSDDKVLVSRALLESSVSIPRNRDEFKLQVEVIEQIRALLAQPSDGALTNEEAEPVAWMLADAVGGSCLEFQRSDLADNQNRYGGEVVPLFRDAPATAPASVVLPEPVAWRVPVNGEWFYGTEEQCKKERAEYESTFCIDELDEEGREYPEPLACLDRVKELNS